MTNDILLHVAATGSSPSGARSASRLPCPNIWRSSPRSRERDAELAEKLARDHTLSLAAYVETHGKELLLA